MRYSFCVSALALAMAMAAPAQAQQAPGTAVDGGGPDAAGTSTGQAALSASSSAPTAAAAAVDPADPQDIIVTAQRRAERLRDVPMAITAITAESLVQSGISQTADLARVTPGLILPYYGGGIQPALRGVSSQGGNVGDASNVAIYLDGVYQPNPLGNIFDLADASQIQVLKGPQGTLYGQNATGGAIIITTAAPSFDWTGLLKAGIGNYANYLGTGYISGPLIEDKVAISLSGLYEDRKGFRRHVISGERDKGLESRLIRGKLLFRPAENIDLTLIGYVSRREDSSPYAGHTYLGNSVGNAFIPNFPRITSSKQYEADPIVDTELRAKGASLNTTIGTGIGDLSTVTSYARTAYDFLADADYSPVRYFTTQQRDGSPSLFKTHTFIQELNFASDKFGAFTVTAGLFYLDGDSELVPSSFIIRAPVLVPNTPGAITTSLDQSGRVDKKIFAGYLELGYDISDSFVLTVGGRYSSEKQHLTNDRGFFDGVLREPPIDPTGARVSRRTFKKFVPRATLRYALSSTDNLFASASRGFKSGILQSDSPAADPEVLTAYEIGYKGRPVDGVEVSLSGFLYNYKDLQVFRFVPPTSILENAASVRIKGLDAEASIRVSPQLRLNVGAEFLDGKYRNFPNAAIFVTRPGNIGNATVAQDLSGKRISRAPKFTGNVSANFTQPTSIGEFGAFAGFYHNSGYDLELSGKIPQRRYNTLDAELSFAPGGIDGLRVVLWGRNLTDDAYIASALPSSLADGVTLAPPRTYGVRAEFRF